MFISKAIFLVVLKTAVASLLVASLLVASLLVAHVPATARLMFVWLSLTQARALVCRPFHVHPPILKSGTKSLPGMTKMATGSGVEPLWPR